MKFDDISKKNQEYVSITYGFIRFIDCYVFLSSSLDSLVKTLVDNSHETLKNLKGEMVLNDLLLNIVNEIGEKDKTIKDLKKDYPDKVDELEETLLVYIGENDPKNLKTKLPDNIWKYITKKLVYPCEYFNCLDDYQRPATELKTENFLNKSKNKCPRDEEIERAMEFIEKLNIKNGERLTRIFLKSDLLLLTCMLEEYIKVSINKFDINSLFCVSRPGYTWQCGLKNTGINLQTLQDKHLFLKLENNTRGGIRGAVRDRYVKSVKKIKR